MNKLTTLVAVVCSLAACKTDAPPPAPPQPPGDSKAAQTHLLEAGANVLQSFGPVKQISIHMDGFHRLRDTPAQQMEAHHYCTKKNEDFSQCVIYDSDGAQANLVGVEYIISGKLFAGLSQTEKKLWHSHNYEVTSGQLVAPRLPESAEHELVRQMLGTYGKTWHMWTPGTDETLPQGAPQLAWSFDHDGQVQAALIENRDRRLNVNTANKRAARVDLAEQVAQGAPQAG